MESKNDLTQRLKLKLPLIVAPMAGGPSTPELVIASSRAGALGSMGAAYSSRAAIEEFAAKVRAKTDRPFGINLFIAHPEPRFTQAQLAKAIEATKPYRDELGLSAPELKPPYEENFDERGRDHERVGYPLRSLARSASRSDGDGFPRLPGSWNFRAISKAASRIRITKNENDASLFGAARAWDRKPFHARSGKESRRDSPFPAQNRLTRDLRTASAKQGSSDLLSLWCGTGEGSLWRGSAEELIAKLAADLAHSG